MKGNKLSGLEFWGRYAYLSNAPCLRLLTWCAVLSILLVGGRAHAIFVPDPQGNPVWYQLSQLGDDSTPSNSPNTADENANGIVDWMDQFNEACSNGWLSYWGGGTWYVDGVSTTYGGVWHASNVDGDGDLIPDDIDLYPGDSNNHSFYFGGGWYTVNGSNYYLTDGVGWYPISADANSNGVPDPLEPSPPNDPPTDPPPPITQYWQGGTFWYNGYQQYFPAQTYQADSYVDSDSDGIPDQLDPCPSDPWNNTSYYWSGGDYPINGVITHFPPATYGGLWADTDWDGIPDAADPYASDSANNSAYWQGGSFMIDGTWQTFSGQYLPAGYADSDSDGIPDPVDPLPYDSSNYHGFTFQGGTWTICNQPVYFSPTTYFGTWMDSDNDGLPDAADPYPQDSNNGNVAQNYYWPGGTYLISDQWVTLSSATYDGAWMDSDNDGIPDPADPYPSDSNNNNQVTWFYWQGGDFYIDNYLVTFSGNNYPGTWNDSDGDGIPDSVDPYPWDYYNNCSYNWPGGVFRVDNADRVFDAVSIQGIWRDSDGDSIPDPVDPYPYDSNNNNTVTETFHWEGGIFQIDNQAVTFPPSDYPGTWADTDSDGIPDVADPYLADANNGNTFDWEGGTFQIRGVDVILAGGTFPGIWKETDGDSIPDNVDPYPFDAYNLTHLIYWQGGVFLVDNIWVNFSPSYVPGYFNDSDQDGLPDMVDPYIDDPNNGNTFTTFYWQGGTFHIDDMDTTFAPGEYFGSSADQDTDGIPDAVDPYLSDSNNGNHPDAFYWVGGIFHISDVDTTLPAGIYFGSSTDVDGDGIPDAADPYPSDSNNNNTVPPPTFHWAGGTFMVDGYSSFWSEGDYAGTWSDSDGDGLPDVVDPYVSDSANNSAYWAGGTWTISNSVTDFPGVWHRADDWMWFPDNDQDGLPNAVDPYQDDPRNNTGFTWPSSATNYVIANVDTPFYPAYYAVAWSDVDNDGIPDVADPYIDDANNHNGGGDGGTGGGGDGGTGGGGTGGGGDGGTGGGGDGGTGGGGDGGTGGGGGTSCTCGGNNCTSPSACGCGGGAGNCHNTEENGDSCPI